uniref:BRF1 RNA polymerase III transcription initiation factor subunit a n=1 Tax=Cyprinus carpio carpio TaxID=630221 RepID=A0A9J7YZQ9_CYPCA
SYLTHILHMYTQKMQMRFIFFHIVHLRRSKYSLCSFVIVRDLFFSDLCIYICFAQMLEFGEKSHEVSMTALRLLQRMKRDWMHTGRRPSGLCGAALLVAARMHEFRRTIKEVIHVVKVYDVISLASSSIIADDEEGEDDELSAAASHLCSTICGEDGGDNEQERDGEKVSLTKRPSLALLLGALLIAASLGLPESITKMGEEKENDVEAENGELNLSGIDEDEIDRVMFFPSEKEERIAKEKEEGKYKEQKVTRRCEPINASTADEAIEKMLEQKRISTKINYDVLKDLNKSSPKSLTRQTEDASAGAKRTLADRQRKPQLTSPKIGKIISSFGKRLQPLVCAQPSKKLALDQKGIGAPVATPAAPTQNAVVVESGPVAYEEPVDEEEEDEEDEHCVSAVQLMGGTDYGYDVDDDDGF